MNTSRTRRLSAGLLVVVLGVVGFVPLPVSAVSPAPVPTSAESNAVTPIPVPSTAGPNRPAGASAALPLRSAATRALASLPAPTAQVVAAARFPAIPDGTRVRYAGDPYYRTWYVVGGALLDDVWLPRDTYDRQPVAVTIGYDHLLSLPKVPADGTFVVHEDNQKVYQFVGGAPVYIDTWAAHGGSQPVTRVGRVGISLVDNYNGEWQGPVPGPVNQPADGTVVRSGEDNKLYTFAGGAPIRLDSWETVGGYRWVPTVTRRSVAEAGRGNWSNLLPSPREGTFLQSGSEVYQIVGGAPVYLRSWADVAKPRTPIRVTWSAIGRAGTGDWSNLRSYPVDGTLVGTTWQHPTQGQIYTEFQFLGGAPMRTDQGATFGWLPGVSPATITEAGTGRWSNLRRTPLDGAYFSDWNGRVYQTIGSAAVHVDSWAAVGGQRPAPVVRFSIFNQFDRPEPWYLRNRPADGTLVGTYGDGRIYQFVGGAPVYVDTWAGIGGFRSFTWVNRSAVVGAGTGSWANLLRAPADGTFVEASDRRRVYRFIGGAPVYVDSWSPFGGVQRTLRVTAATVPTAGTGSWSNLNRVPRDGTVVLYQGQYHRFVGGALVRDVPWSTVTPVDMSFLNGKLGAGQWWNLKPELPDGTFVTDPEGHVFRMAGGAAIHIDAWAPFGGPQPSVKVNLSLMSGSSLTDRWIPRDGTFVSTPDGRVYHYVGGAALYLSNWADVGGQRPTVTVPAGAVERPGTAGWRYLPTAPADSTFVRLPDGRVYNFAGGAPLYVTDWASFGGQRPATAVSAGVADQAGTGNWASLNRAPRNGTRVFEAGGRDVYVFAGGAPVWIQSLDFGIPDAVAVSSGAVRTPEEGPWAGLRRTPADGTQVVARTTHYRIEAGRLVALPPNPAPPAPPVWSAKDSVRVHVDLPVAAGTGMWPWILPPL